MSDTASPVFRSCYALEDLRPDAFQVVAEKQAAELPWRYALQGTEADLLQLMVADCRAIVHHVRQGEAGWLLIARLSTRPPKLRARDFQRAYRR